MEVINKRVGVRLTPKGEVEAVLPPGHPRTELAVIREEHVLFSNGEDWRLVAVVAGKKKEVLMDVDHVVYEPPRSSAAAVLHRRQYWTNRLAAFDEAAS
jgi:hypothetical protein